MGAPPCFSVFFFVVVAVFSAIFTKENNRHGLLIASLRNIVLSKKGTTSVASCLLSCRTYSFQKGACLSKRSKFFH